MSGLRERLDLISLVAGVAVCGLGALIVLQEDGSIALEAGWLLSALAAGAGVVLVASGMGARHR